MDYVKGFAGSVKRRFLGPQDDDGAEEANDLNHAHSPELPAYPWGSTSASPEPSPAPVDSYEPYEGHLLPNSSQSRLQHQTDNGKRRPSDGTKAPNPANGYQGPPASMKKPDAGMGVQRINTLNGPHAFGTNPAHVRKKTTTYSTLDRNTKSIGLQRHGGQQAWLDRNPHPRYQTAAPATRNAPSARPLKRRKTENRDAAPRNTIELVDSDVDEIQSPQGTPPQRQASKFLSGSPRSTTSRHSGRSTNRAPQPASEFLTITDSLAPKRVKQPRRKGPSGHDASRRASQPEILFEGAGTQTQEEQFVICEDDKKRSSRSQILENHEQGVRDESLDNKRQISTGLTSKHFPPSNPQMRINESTKAESTAKEDESRAIGKLRHFRHAEQASEVHNDLISSSGDELSQADAPEPKSKRSPIKRITVKEAISKQRSTVGGPYQLLYARSHEFGFEKGHLTLEHAGNKTFRIDGRYPDGKVILLKMLDLSSVNRVKHDNIRRMRVLGPIKDGKRYWCDLEFTELMHFNEFRSRFVDPEVPPGGTAVYPKDHMQALFNVPLTMNNKIGTMPMVNEETSSEQTSSKQGRTSRDGLISGLTTSSKASNNATSVSTQPLARPARVTRATAPIYDREVIDEGEPVRYSRNHGLGKRWAKPLDYSVDRGFLKRRKATIEFDDLEKLDEGQMLNDSIMTFYMLYLFEQLNVSIDQVYFFNTHFFPTLTKKVKGQDGVNYEGVRSWTKRDDVFSYDYLVVPMHEDLHWYLGIICNVNNIKRKPEHEPLQEDSPDLNHGPASLRASEIPTAASDDIDSGKPNETNAATTALDNAADTKHGNNDDVHALEQEKELDLIDPNAETVDGHKQSPNGRTVEGDVSLVVSLPAAPTEYSSKLASGKVKQAPKKKRDRGPPARDPDKPVIMMLDSLGQTRTVATRALRQWLEAEGKDKRGLGVEIDNRGFYPKGTQIPTQANYSDCGLYVLGYLRKFFTNPDDFTKKLLRFEMSAESDWPDMNPSKMREEIRNLIFEMNEARNGARKEAHKAKKQSGSGHGSASPTHAGAEKLSPAVKQPMPAETQDAAAADAVIEVTPTSAGTAGEIVMSPADAPRLRSPFRPESSHAEDKLASTDAVQKDYTARASTTAQGSPNLSTTTLAGQRHSPAKRANSPQVRVPAISPDNLSTYTLFDDAGDLSTQPTRQPADLTRSQQDRDLHGKSDGKLRMPSVKSGKASSPLKPPRERLAPSNPSQARPRSGSHDDPIPVDDSQDLDVPVRKHAQSARKPPPEVIELDRSQESVHGPARRVQRHAQSSPICQREARWQAFDRDDSIREVDGREWEDQHDTDVVRAIDLSLEEERQQLSRVADDQPARDASMHDVFDARAAYSPFSHTTNEVQDAQDSHTMDVDTNDQVIPESPPQRRSSPSSDIMMMD